MTTHKDERNHGHGHVFERPDGMRARCGGPGICSECAKDLARKVHEEANPATPGTCAQGTVRESWPDPTPEMLDHPLFNAIWDVIKTWDVNVPRAYIGYCGANGNHVRAIYDAILQAFPSLRGWEPMSSAPRDGLFLVGSAHAPYDMMIISGSTLQTLLRPGKPRHLEPRAPYTHWQHLPAAPATGEKPNNTTKET